MISSAYKSGTSLVLLFGASPRAKYLQVSEVAIQSSLTIAIAILAIIAVLGPKSDTLEQRAELLRSHVTISCAPTDGPHVVGTLYHGYDE